MINKGQILKRVTTVLIVLFSIAGLCLLIFIGLGSANNLPDKSNLVYDIQKFKIVPEEYICYKEQRQITIEAEKLYGIAIDSSDNLYLSGDLFLMSFTDKGELFSKIQLKEAARCIAVDEEGIVYLGMTDHVEIYNSKTKDWDMWASLGNNAIITSIAVGKDFVFVADAGNQVIIKYDTQGKLIQFIGRKDAQKEFNFIIPSPYFDIALAQDQTLWAANSGTRKLINFDLTGKFIKSWGISSPKIEGFVGCCNPIHFTLMRDGSFVTSEKGLARVKIYSAVGGFQCVVASPASFSEHPEGLDLAINSKAQIYILDQSKKMVRIFSKKEDA